MVGATELKTTKGREWKKPEMTDMHVLTHEILLMTYSGLSPQLLFSYSLLSPPLEGQSLIETIVSTSSLFQFLLTFF